MQGVPKLKLYYCEKCKAIVFPVDVEISIGCSFFPSIPYLSFIEIARHKKCGSVLKEKSYEKTFKG